MNRKKQKNDIKWLMELLNNENNVLREENRRLKNWNYELLEEINLCKRQMEALRTAKLEVWQVIQQCGNDYDVLPIIKISETPSGVQLIVGS